MAPSHDGGKVNVRGRAQTPIQFYFEVDRSARRRTLLIGTLVCSAVLVGFQVAKLPIAYGIGFALLASLVTLMVRLKTYDLPERHTKLSAQTIQKSRAPWALTRRLGAVAVALFVMSIVPRIPTKIQAPQGAVLAQANAIDRTKSPEKLASSLEGHDSNREYLASRAEADPCVRFANRKRSCSASRDRAAGYCARVAGCFRTHIV